MSKFEAAVIYGSLIGFVSTLFMGLVFYNEAILHRGILFIEPNLWIATVELIMVVVGAIISGFTMIALTLASHAEEAEPDEDTMPKPAEAPKRLWT